MGLLLEMELSTHLSQPIRFSVPPNSSHKMPNQNEHSDEHWLDRIWDAYLRKPSGEKEDEEEQCRE